MCKSVQSRSEPRGGAGGRYTQAYGAGDSCPIKASWGPFGNEECKNLKPGKGGQRTQAMIFMQNHHSSNRIAPDVWRPSQCLQQLTRSSVDFTIRKTSLPPDHPI